MAILASVALRKQMQASAEQQFTLHTNEVVALIENRLWSHEQILLGGAALFAASKEVDRDEWRAYIDRLSLATRYPGIQGVGYSKVIQPAELQDHIAAVRTQGFPDYTVRPAGARPLYTSIIYLEPFSGRNLAAFGYDMYSEPTRNAAMRYAAENGVTSISGKVKLVQENQGKPQAGFLMYVPIYRNGAPKLTVEQRLAALEGFVYSPYRVNDLMRGILQIENLFVDFEIFDGEVMSDDARMYASGDDRAAIASAGGRPEFTAARAIRSYGNHAWTIRVVSRPEFSAKFDAWPSVVVLVLGSGISVLVWLLVFSLADTRQRERARASELAYEMTEEIRRNEEKLRASEERFDLAVRGSNDGIWDWNILTGEVYYSPRFHELLGLPPGALGSGLASWANLLHPDDHDAVMAAQQAHLDTGAPYNVEYRLGVDASGTHQWRWFNARGLDIRNADGVAVRMAGSMSDITARREARDALHSTLGLQQAILSNTAHGIIATRPDGVITVFNRRAEAMLGYTAEEMIGKQTPAVFHLVEEVVERSVKLSAHLETAIEPGFEVFVAKTRRGLPNADEWTYRRKDGTCFPVDLVITAIRDMQGEITGFLGLALDITDRKKTEEEINRISGRLAAATQAARVGIWEYDVVHNTLAWDDTMYGLYGISHDTFSGVYDAWRNGVHPDDQSRGDREIELALSGTAPFDTSFRVVWPSGEVRWIRAVATVLRDAEGRALSMVGTNWDITAEKKADQAKAEFVSTVSHELRTPLTSISGALGLITGGAVGALPITMKPMLDIAYKNSLRLSHLINDLLDIEKLAAGKMSFDFQVMDLMPIVEQCVESNRAYAESFKATYRIGHRADDVKVRVDSSRLQQVLANFLSNGAKFSPEGAEVTIDVVRQGNSVRISVTDRGSGIPENFRDRIFQKFSQADSSDTKSKSGTGLGLAICKELVERMNGLVGFTSVVGKGSTFHCELPVIQPEPALVSRTLPPASGDAPRLLVVEDEPDIAQVLEEMLRSAGYQVDLAGDCEAASALLARHDYVAVTLDLMLPDRNGVSLVRQIRRDPRTFKLPIVVVSAYSVDGKLALGGEFNAIDWIEKPIDQPRLIDAIRRVAGDRVSGARGRVLHVEDDSDFSTVLAALGQHLVDFDTANTLAEARDLLKRHVYQAIVLDLDLPDGNGLGLVSDIRTLDPPPPVIVLSGKAMTPDQRRLVGAGLVKTPDAPDKLLQLIRQVLRERNG